MKTKRRWLRSVIVAAQAPLPTLPRTRKAPRVKAPVTRPAIAAR